VSWQLASFALVLGSLAGAFWWYERSHPSPRLLAVVATLAALAALGRDAFAAVPDVKPITAIVLIGGVAFGAAPGFAIGALSALASNLLLGEGPWTPWQMLGWGVVGLIGALIGWATRGRTLPAPVLALACAASAEVFNLILDLYTWTGTGDHTAAGFGIVLGSALVFDLTHVAASFVFALAFGGVLLRMLARVRARLHVTWEPVSPALLAVLALVCGAASLAALACANVPQARASQGSRGDVVASTAVVRQSLARELAFLQGAQNPDGGFGGARGQSSSELYTAWAAMGLAAAGRSPLSVRNGGHSPLSVLVGQAGTLHGTGDIERTILALHACGVSARSPVGGAGGDLVRRLLRSRSRDGSFGHLVNLTAFGVFALRAAGYSAGNPAVRAAGHWLSREQGADGGFGLGGSGSDVDDTAAVIQALIDTGVPANRRGIMRAGAFLVHAQNPDGGYPQQPGGLSNAQSTAWAVQALVASGRDPGAVHHNGSRSPVGYLLTLVAADGSVRYSRIGAQTPVWVTAQALTALARKPFPIAPVRRRAHAAGLTGSRGATARRQLAGSRGRAPTNAAKASPVSVQAMARALVAVLAGAVASLGGW
jgi:energy-coupling factor transport system substrate-specific component